MASPRRQLDRRLIVHRVTSVASMFVLGIVALVGCAATTPQPAAPPRASRAPGPCWLLNIEEVTNNTMEQQGDSLQLVASYRFGAGHEAEGHEHSRFELSSRDTRWRSNEWPDRLDTDPVAVCTPEAMQAPDRVNGQVSPTH